MIIIYPALFHPNANDGSITITFPDLPGCTSEGKDLANAMYMAREALAQWADTMNMLGEEIPPPSPVRAILPLAGSYVTLIDADPEPYQRRRRNRAVRRTVSLPEWLDDMASEANISLSKQLQDALCAKFNVSAPTD